MKKFKNIGFAFILLISLSSCNKQLDLESKQNIDADKAILTESDVKNTLVGAYTILATGDLYGTNLVFIPDLYAANDYLNWFGTFNTYRNIYNKAIIATNADVQRTWVSAYDAINVANILLTKLDLVKSADTKAEVEGKAKFIRGIMQFELVRLYAQQYDPLGTNTGMGVPLITKPVNNISEVVNNVARSTIQQVYTAAENDLVDAIAKLSSINSKDQYAAKAFLARLYLQQSKFVQARDIADDIITNSPFRLITNSVEAPFRTKNSAEGIFEIQQNEQSNAGTSNDGLATFYSSYKNNSGGNVGRGDARVNTTFANSFESGDKRRTELIYTGTGLRNGLFTKKWYSFYDNIPVCRITEQYLIRAEANFREGTTVGATPLDDINALRVRAGLTSLTSITDVQTILSEREKELAYEGFRLHDYKRTHRSLGSTTYDDPKLVLPIPDREVRINNLLIQNPGYN